MQRRQFLKHALMGAAFYGLSGLTVLAPPRAQASTSLDVSLTAEAAAKALVDGKSVQVWRFRDLSGWGPGELASGLVLQEGQDVRLTLHNDLDRSVRFVVPGAVISGPAIAPGDSYTHAFEAPAAGSYLYHDDANGEIGRAMGLSGPMVVMPADGSSRLHFNGEGFDLQYTLVLGNLDDRLNQAVASGGSYEMAGYEPNYFFVNGLSYPHTATNGDTFVSMRVGDVVALRFINAGMIACPMHFHGYHVEVVARDREPEGAVIEKDTVLVGIGECVDVLLRCTQPGIYPLHSHFVPAVTANGVYLNPFGGALIVMKAR
jgi:FtsP/CotA-like multicopper oxidase with cupredoxin domain